MGWYGLYAALEMIDAATRTADHDGIEAASRRFVAEYTYLANPNSPTAALEIALEEFVARHHRSPFVDRGIRGSMSQRAYTALATHGGADADDTRHAHGHLGEDKGAGKRD